MSKSSVKSASKDDLVRIPLFRVHYAQHAFNPTEPDDRGNAWYKFDAVFSKEDPITAPHWGEALKLIDKLDALSKSEHNKPVMALDYNTRGFQVKDNDNETWYTDKTKITFHSYKMTFKSKFPLIIFTPDLMSKYTEANENTDGFYSGCYAVAAAKLAAYSGSKIKPGVRFDIIQAQKVRDGEPLGRNRSAPLEVFSAIDDDSLFEDAEF